MKYLIMQVKKSYAVALAEDDTFYIVANRHYQVGQYVNDPVIMKEYVEKTTPSFFSFYKKGLALGLGIAMAFVLVFGYNHYLDTVIGSYVIHADSVVEIMVNRSGTVDKIIAKNELGEKLLDGYDYKNKNKEVVTRELIERAKELGYVKGQLDISVNSDAKYYQQLKDELYTIIIDFEDDDFEFEINLKDKEGFEEDDDDIEEDFDDLDDYEIEDQKEDDRENSQDDEEDDDDDDDQTVYDEDDDEDECEDYQDEDDDDDEEDDDDDDSCPTIEISSNKL